MSFENTAAYPTIGTRYRVDGVDLVGVQNVSGIGSGSSSEIDITTQISNATEYDLGLPDEGSVTFDGILALQHPLTATLEKKRRNSEEVSVEIYVGDVPANEHKTDGGGHTKISGLAVAASLAQSKTTYTTTKDANEITSVAIGDYVKDGSNHYKITNTARAGNKLVITTDGTATSSATSIDIVRPGVKYAFSGRIGTFDKSASVNEVWRFSLTVRITGSVTITIGNPDVTVS